jgi:polygalacturonase
MMIRLPRPLFALALILCGASANAKTFLADDYGAKGDGSTLNTAAIQKTIDAASKGGGTVIMRPGNYLTGSLFLNVSRELK